MGGRRVVRVEGGEGTEFANVEDGGRTVVFGIEWIP